MGNYLSGQVPYNLALGFLSVNNGGEGNYESCSMTFGLKRNLANDTDKHLLWLVGKDTGQ
jgi:hypothetical protein